MLSLLFAPALLPMASAPMPRATFAAEGQAACAAPIGIQPVVQGIRIEPLPTRDAELPGFRVTDEASGGWMNVYYEPAFERSARARVACLGAEIHLLAQETGGLWRNGRWFSVTFTPNTDYVPPRDEAELRWSIITDADGTLGEEAQHRITIVMPHEQVHAFQKRAGAATPRWFGEGHAEWIGRKVASILSPDASRRNSARYASLLAASAEAPKLRSWGSVIVKQEAILRQVSAADREKMRDDPTYAPPGPFTFGPADLTVDEGVREVRYQAAWQVFRDLETAHGAAAITDWVGTATAKPEKVKSIDLEQSARGKLHEDIARRL